MCPSHLILHCFIFVTISSFNSCLIPLFLLILCSSSVILIGYNVVRIIILSNILKSFSSFYFISNFLSPAVPRYLKISTSSNSCVTISILPVRALLPHPIIFIFFYLSPVPLLYYVFQYCLYVSSYIYNNPYVKAADKNFSKLDFYQPPEQVEFRKKHSTADHI